jgi:hypothetical protein
MDGEFLFLSPPVREKLIEQIGRFDSLNVFVEIVDDYVIIHNDKAGPVTFQISKGWPDVPPKFTTPDYEVTYANDGKMYSELTNLDLVGLYDFLSGLLITTRYLKWEMRVGIMFKLQRKETFTKSARFTKDQIQSALQLTRGDTHAAARLLLRDI